MAPVSSKLSSLLRIVDQHIESLKEILAEDTSNVGIDRAEIQEIVYKDFLVDDSIGSGFKQVELGEGSR